MNSTLDTDIAHLGEIGAYDLNSVQQAARNMTAFDYGDTPVAGGPS